MLARIDQMTETKGKSDQIKCQSDMSDANVTLDLSKMSLPDRARLGAMVEADGDEGLRIALIGALGTAKAPSRQRREVPDHWTQIHVLDRLEDAYRVLATQPGEKRGSVSVWPQTAVQPMSLYDKVMLIQAGELEQIEEERNRVRFTPTSIDISQMEQALAWPFHYLRDRPHLARAIQLRAMWAAMGVDIKKRCRRRGLDHDGFNRAWQDALAYITGALITDRVQVS